MHHTSDTLYFIEYNLVIKLWVAPEVGKIRPVLIFQNNDLNESSYPTTMVIPLTTVLIDNVPRDLAHCPSEIGVAKL